MIKILKKVVEIIINTIIKKIKNNNCLNKCEKYDDLWVEMQYRFTDMNTKSEIWDEADCISDSIVKKLFGKNGRTIDLPIKIKYLKEYGIDYFIHKEDIKIMLMYIVIQLLILVFILNNNIVSK